MKLEEVIPALREGKSIRRKVWDEDCYVRKSKSEYKSQYIFYFYGEDYEEWKPSMIDVGEEDWETKEADFIPSSGHSWIWALYEMREGKKVRRREWREGLAICLFNSDIIYTDSKKALYNPPITSMLAEDWEVVE